MKVAINVCFGGFGLSEAAYEKLIEWGIPVRAYVEEERDEETGLYKRQPLNEGEIIFDRALEEARAAKKAQLTAAMRRLSGRYWESWTSSDKSREHPLVIRAIEELGDAANGRCAKLKIVEIPDGTEYVIEEYDGFEHIAEAHRTWS